MKLSRRTKVVAAVAGAASFALLAAGCSSSGGGSGSSSSPITLTVTTFGTMGFDELYAAVREGHTPNITIKATNIDTGGNALTDWQTKQAAGSGLPDVQAVEEGWLSKVMQVSDQFNDLKDYGANDIKGRWVDWKVKQATDTRTAASSATAPTSARRASATTASSSQQPACRATATPSPTLFGGDNATWDKFFEVGKQYKDATGKAFYDQSGFVWNAMVNQLPEGYYTKDGKLNVEDNADLKALLGPARRRARPPASRANQTQWDWGKGKAFTDGTFADLRLPGLDARCRQGPGRGRRRRRRRPAGTSRTSSRVAQPTGADRS